MNNWYGRSTAYGQSAIQPFAINQLLDSTPIGNWMAVYETYNCYAYALGYRLSPTEDDFFPHPGSFSNPSDFDINDTVEAWAELTIEDLHEENYSCVHTTSSYPSAMALSSTHSIICLRKGYPTDNSTNPDPDYHYMVLSGSSWNHKPGLSQPLQFKYVPYYKDWSNEGIKVGVTTPVNCIYSGTIYYFAYRNSHSLTSIYNNFHYHLGNYHYLEYATTCRYCGEVTELTLTRVECSGPPCMVAHPAALLDESIGE